MQVRGQEERACAKEGLGSCRNEWQEEGSDCPAAEHRGLQMELVSPLSPSIPSRQMPPPAPSLPSPPNSLTHKPQREILRPKPGLLGTVFGVLHGSSAGPLGCPPSLREPRRRCAPASELCSAVACRELSDTAGASSLQTIPYFNGASPPKLII